MIKNGHPITELDDGTFDFELLSDKQFDENREVIIEWIKNHIFENKNCQNDSYGFKHQLEKETGIYMTNNAFKDAMLICGFEPNNPDDLNWRYKAVYRKPKKGGESVSVKDEIRKLLKDTKREGIEDLCEYMEHSGYYTAPASSLHHSCDEGGLAKHSLNVMDCARSIAVALLGKKWWNENKDSVAICALLHDLGKCGDYGLPFYSENILKTTGKRSEKKPWERNKDLPNIPHAFRSVIIINRFMDLTPEEEYAIMYHDGLYDRETGGAAVIPKHETPLLLILHWADMWSARFLEKGVDGDDKS